MNPLSPSLIPAPQSFEASHGFFSLPSKLEIVADKAFALATRYLEEKLCGAAGVSVSRLDRRVDSVVTISRAEMGVLPDEGYELVVETKRVMIVAADPAGAFYGVVTFLQLLPPAIWGQGPRLGIEWVAPCCRIIDGPRFKWRGMMLDSARSFQSVDEIKRWIDLLAQHKLNVFHWHLSDNQGWRIEIQRYPELTRVGAWRSGTQKGHTLAGGESDGVPYGGFYSQAEIREIIAYAEARAVTIVPEIGLPGHAQAAIASYPRLGTAQEPCEVNPTWSGNDQPKALLLPLPETLEFFFGVFDEIANLFPGAVIHIGGDEAPKELWRNSALARQRATDLCLADTDALYAWFINKISEHLEKRGKRAIGWDEISEHPIRQEAIVHSWRGHAGALRAVKRGHSVVMAPYHATYFDYYQSPEIWAEPLGNRDIDVPSLSLSQVYGYEPIPVMFTPEEEQLVLGIQGQMWTEYMSDFSIVEYMAFPRVCALSEVAWRAKGNHCFSGFLERLSLHLKRLECQCVRYRPL